MMTPEQEEGKEEGSDEGKEEGKGEGKENISDEDEVMSPPRTYTLGVDALVAIALLRKDGTKIWDAKDDMKTRDVKEDMKTWKALHNLELFQRNWQQWRILPAETIDFLILKAKIGGLVVSGTEVPEQLLVQLVQMCPYDTVEESVTYLRYAEALQKPTVEEALQTVGVREYALPIIAKEDFQSVLMNYLALKTAVTSLGDDTFPYKSL